MRPATNTWRRPMTGWWRRNPFYRRYMLRELTSIVIVAWALFLLCGVWHLAQGREAYEAWRALLARPAAIVLHAATFAAVLYHAWTWFQVMPKTLPFVRIGGRRVTDREIVGGGLAAAAIMSAALIAVALCLSR